MLCGQNMQEKKAAGVTIMQAETMVRGHRFTTVMTVKAAGAVLFCDLPLPSGLALLRVFSFFFFWFSFTKKRIRILYASYARPPARPPPAHLPSHVALIAHALTRKHTHSAVCYTFSLCLYLYSFPFC